MSVLSLALVVGFAFGLSSGLNYQQGRLVFQPRPLSNAFIPQQECKWKGAFRVNNKCYYVEQNEDDWRAAQRFCFHLGGKLAEPTTGNAYFSLISSLRKQGLTRESYFIGANNIGGYSQQQWRWNTAGVPVHDAFWTVTITDGKFVKEPQPHSGLNLNCAKLDASRSHFINRVDCNSRQSFLCETDANIPRSPEQPRPSYNFFYGEEETTTSTNLHCPDKWILYEYGTSCYLFDEGPLSFYEAINHCEKYGANLVAISDEDEDIYLKEKLTYFNHTSGWTGLIRTYSEGYHYTSGESFDYENWKEPVSESYQGIETCLEITPDGWNEDYCILAKGFVCEKEAMEDYDANY